MKQRQSPLPACLSGAARILFLIAVAVAPIVAGGFALAPQMILTGVLLLAGALRLTADLLSRERERLSTPVDIAIALLLGGALLSLPFSVNRHASVIEFLRLLSCLVAFTLAAEMAATPQREQAAEPECAPAPPSPSRGRRSRAKGAAPVPTPAPRRPLVLPHPLALLWVALVAGAAWAAASGVQEYAAVLRAGNATWRTFGGFSHPNTLAGHLILTMPLLAAAALMLRARTDEWRGTWPIPAALLLISAAALLFTASRLGIAAGIVGLFVFVLRAIALRRRLTWKHLAGMSGGLVLAAGIALVAVPTLRLRLEAVLSGKEAFSLGFRVTTWEAGWRMFLAHPLTGSGTGTFSNLMTRFSETRYTQTAHSHLIQTASETGILGLLGLVGLLAFWFLAVRGKRAEAPLSAYFVTAAVAGVAASTAHALVDFDWSIPATGWVLWAMLGAGLGAWGQTRQVAARPGRVAVVLVILVAALVPTTAISLGAIHAARAEALRDEAPLLAVAEWQEALGFDPFSPETHRELGRMLGGIGLTTGDRGRLAAGEEHLERSTRLAPTTAITYYHLGLLRLRAGDQEGGTKALEEGLRWDPRSTYMLRQLGVVYAETRPEETLRIARQLVALEEGPYEHLRPIDYAVDPNYAFAHYWLGREKARTGDREGALAAYDRAEAVIDRFEASRKDLLGAMVTHADPEVSALRGEITRARGE